MSNTEQTNLIEVPMPRLAGFDLSEEMAKRPYTVLGLGVLAGYVLGGGIFTRLTGRLVGMGLRTIAVPLLTKAAVVLVENALQPHAEVASSQTVVEATPPS